MRRLLSAGTATLLVSLITLHADASVLTSNFVYNDLLSHPQYQLHFVREPIPQSSVSPNVLRFGNNHHARPQTKSQRKQESIEGEAPAGQTQESDLWSKASRMIMKSSDGQRWACDIPEPLEETTTDSIKLSSAELEKEESRLIERGLELFHGTKDNCIRLTLQRAYWTYEFCYKDKIEQYHLAQDINKNIVKEGFTYTIALYKPDTEDSAGLPANAAQKSLQKPPKTLSGMPTRIKETHDRKQLVQEWTGGTTCDLTKRPRRATVHYQCDPTLKRDEITTANELATCVYTIVISSPRLCKEPAFLPVPQPEPAIVECRPVISDEEHERFLLHHSIDGATSENGATDESLAHGQLAPPPALPQPPSGPPAKTLVHDTVDTKKKAELPKEKTDPGAGAAAAAAGSTGGAAAGDDAGEMSLEEMEQWKVLFNVYRKVLDLNEMTFEEFVDSYSKILAVYEKLFPGGAFGLDMADLGFSGKKQEKDSETGDEK